MLLLFLPTCREHSLKSSFSATVIVGVNQVFQRKSHRFLLADSAHSWFTSEKLFFDLQIPKYVTAALPSTFAPPQRTRLFDHYESQRCGGIMVSSLVQN